MLWYSASLSTLAGQNSNNSQHWQTLKSLFSSESPSYSLPDFKEFLSMHLELNIQPKTQGDPMHISGAPPSIQFLLCPTITSHFSSPTVWYVSPSSKMVAFCLHSLPCALLCKESPLLKVEDGIPCGWGGWVFLALRKFSLSFI